MTNYSSGFFRKCAEYRIPYDMAVAMYKAAATPAPAQAPAPAPVNPLYERLVANRAVTTPLSREPGRPAIPSGKPNAKLIAQQAGQHRSTGSIAPMKWTPPRVAQTKPHPGLPSLTAAPPASSPARREGTTSWRPA